MDSNEAIEIVYPYTNKKTKIKKNKRQMAGGGQALGERSGERFFNFFFLIFITLSDLWKSDRRFSSEQKAKLVYATRATRRYQKLSILSHFKR